MRFTFVVEIICVNLCVLAKASKLKIKALECVPIDPSFCTFDYCILKPINRDIQEISIFTKMLQKPVTNISVAGDIKRRFGTPFYKFKIDACIFFGSKRRNPFANAIYKFIGLDVYSNMNHSCPYDHDLIIDRMRFGDISKLPVPISKGDYVITTTWYMYNALVATVSAIFIIFD